jgi:uncharacterized protein RhaS with RHS repeats
VVEYRYDVLNRLTQFTGNGVTETYGYHPGGMRAFKQSGNNRTNFYYHGGYIINETNGSGADTARNFIGLGGVIGRQTGGQTGYFVKDGHGDVVQVFGNTGNLLADYTYDIWGNVQEQNGTFDNPFRYAGEYVDFSSGLIYLRNRMYDPSIGRFITQVHTLCRVYTQ